MPKAEPAYKIDSTPNSAVVVCKKPGCRWRGIAHTKPSAYRLVSAHLRHVHDDKVTAANAAYLAMRYYQRVSQIKSAGAKVSA